MLADSKANMFNSTVTAAFKIKVFLKLLPSPVPPLSSLLQLTPLTSHILAAIAITLLLFLLIYCT